ncbi:MAG: HAD-IC family P-type ATPase [Bacilli bacterium]|nr:HAD-IC family P-type ATPase [Bacilli bacterium]
MTRGNPEDFRINTDIEKGLSNAQVEERRLAHLTNKKKKQHTKSYWKILFDNVCNPFNLLLFAVMGVMIWAKLSLSHYIFCVVLFANVFIGIYQDIHARHLTEKLKVLSDEKALVIREGKQVQINVDDIVISDILVLKQGNEIPADSIIREGSVSVDESMLTGESRPQHKTVGDEVLSGSFITAGTCLVEVQHVGEDAYAEKIRLIASSFKRPKSEIAQSIWNVTVACSAAALVFAIVYLLITFLRNPGDMGEFAPMTTRGRNIIESLSGLMVAMLPTGMFLLTSIALTTGVIALARKGMLVQELYCIETLARADVVCFDKTGTLTDGNMSVYEVIPLGETKEEEIAFGVSAVLAGTKDNNATAKALRTKFGDSCSKEIETFIPFDSAYRYSAVSFKEGGTYAFGAYGAVPAKKDEEIEKLIEQYSKNGYRCLVLGYSKNKIDNGKLPDNFELCAVLTLLDHIKESAKGNIAWFLSSGVDVRVISGDNPITVAEIARQCGLVGAEHCVDMSGVKKEDIPELVKTVKIFGRVMPEQKEWIVQALQAEGHKVAMTGDGVNDVLALKQADCSIAMASGAAAAKNISHLICTNSDFDALPDVVAQGRRVINNLQRSCSLFLAKTIFALLVSTAFMISMAIGGASYPFETSHMIAWEICAIGIPSFFLALEPNNERLKGSMMGNILAKSLPSGLAEACCVGGGFLLCYLFPSLVAENPNDIFPRMIAVSVISFSFFAYVTLFRVCRPLRKYRGTVFAGSLILGLIVFVIDYFVRDEHSRGVLLQIPWNGLARTFLLGVLIVLAVSTGVYVLANLLIKYIQRKSHDHQ